MEKSTSVVDDENVSTYSTISEELEAWTDVSNTETSAESQCLRLS